MLYEAMIQRRVAVIIVVPCVYSLLSPLESKKHDRELREALVLLGEAPATRNPAAPGGEYRGQGSTSSPAVPGTDIGPGYAPSAAGKDVQPSPAAPGRQEERAAMGEGKS